jgi:hypothetical protein
MAGQGTAVLVDASTLQQHAATSGCAGLLDPQPPVSPYTGPHSCNKLQLPWGAATPPAPPCLSQQTAGHKTRQARKGIESPPSMAQCRQLVCLDTLQSSMGHSKPTINSTVQAMSLHTLCWTALPTLQRQRHHLGKHQSTSTSMWHGSAACICQ